MKKVLLLTSVLACIAFANRYQKCIGCHGANGEKVALGKSKIMKDMTKQEIIDSLKGYKDGSYGGAMKALMKGQVATLSDTDIQTIAEKIGK